MVEALPAVALVVTCTGAVLWAMLRRGSIAHRARADDPEAPTARDTD